MPMITLGVHCVVAEDNGDGVARHIREKLRTWKNGTREQSRMAICIP